VVWDVGAHKAWMVRLYQVCEPGTVIINGLAAMASRCWVASRPRSSTQRRVVEFTGDGTFLKNSQGLETAKRVGASDLVVYARSFGVPGFPPDSTDGLHPTPMAALAVNGPSLVDVPSTSPKTCA
jgi:thiamine pyrophosphate-dependent acetolactate synthase large subunit-like protein